MAHTACSIYLPNSSRTEVAKAAAEACAQQRKAAPLVELTADRIAELKAIAASMPGASRHCERVLEALRRRPLNSLEALYLGSFHVPARIKSIVDEGHHVVDRWVRVRGFDDEVHRVKEWCLIAANDVQAVA